MSKCSCSGPWLSSSHLTQLSCFSKVFPLLWAWSAPETFTCYGSSSSRNLHFVFHSCSGRTEKHPLQRCLCYFYRPPRQHLCSQVSPPGGCGIFPVSLIINSCSSFVSLTSNPLSVISVSAVAASALYLIHQVWLSPSGILLC